MWYTYTLEYYSAIERKVITAFAATWMDLEIIMLSEVVSQTVRHLHQMLLSLTMWNLKKGHNELLCRTDMDSQTLKKLMISKGDRFGSRGMGWGFGMEIL